MPTYKELVIDEEENLFGNIVNAVCERIGTPKRRYVAVNGKNTVILRGFGTLDDAKNKINTHLEDIKKRPAQ